MQLRKLLSADEDRAVSPVIGVILMVAITVILAAVIGTFVLGLGDQVQTTSPSTQISTDVTDNELTFSVDGGQSVEAGLLSLSTTVGDEDLQVPGRGDNSTVHSNATWTDLDSDVDDPSDELSAGDSFTLLIDGGDWESESASIVWEDQGQSSSLAEYEP